jgi:hypothetical protein
MVKKHVSATPLPRRVYISTIDGGNEEGDEDLALFTATCKVMGLCGM